MPESRPSPQSTPFASTTVTRHLIRGALGFSLILGAFALAATVSPIALVLVVPGGVALRGCPACWTVGLIETISAGRVRRSCSAATGARFDRSCQLQAKHSGLPT
jgi:hypothetical protein